MNRFKEIEDKIYEDTKTGLQWSYTICNITWKEAVEVCENLKLGGHNDWRLPTIQELFDIIDYNIYSPATGLPCATSAYHWSVTSVSEENENVWIEEENENVWLMDFDRGYVSSGSKTSEYYVRAVRENQKNQPDTTFLPGNNFQNVLKKIADRLNELEKIKTDFQSTEKKIEQIKNILG